MSTTRGTNESERKDGIILTKVKATHSGDGESVSLWNTTECGGKREPAAFSHSNLSFSQHFDLETLGTLPIVNIDKLVHPWVSTPIFAGLFMAASALALPLDASSSTALKPVEAAKDIAARAPAPQLDLSDVLDDVANTVDDLVDSLEQILDPILAALQNLTVVIQELVVDPDSSDYDVTLENTYVTLQGLLVDMNGITGTSLNSDDVTDLNNLNGALQTLLDTVNNLISVGTVNDTLTNIQTLINTLIANVNTLLSNIST
ncbi:hypothetical protein CLAIMM_08767 [Cladophialophora immunda]|nr:hypothetical protein CLAIMM_08767 [Cladophialophora immunda]